MPLFFRTLYLRDNLRVPSVCPALKFHDIGWKWVIKFVLLWSSFMGELVQRCEKHLQIYNSINLSSSVLKCHRRQNWKENDVRVALSSKAQLLNVYSHRMACSLKIRFLYFASAQLLPWLCGPMKSTFDVWHTGQWLIYYFLNILLIFNFV